MTENVVDKLFQEKEEICRTRDLAIEQVVAAGLEVTDVQRDKSKYPDLHLEIWYHGEKVGYLWSDNLSLIRVYLGIPYERYSSVLKTFVKYKDPDASEKIVAAIHELKDSYRKSEQTIRDAKVKSVKLYFDTRKLQKIVNDIPTEDALW